MTTEKLIYRLDASAIKSSAGCLRALYWRVVKGYSGKGIYNDTAYGSAFHIFKDELKKTKDAFKATTKAYKYFNDCVKSDYFRVRPKKEFLSVGHLAETCQAYIDKFGLNHEKDNFQSLADSASGSLLVERKFQIPLKETETYIIFLCGTIDDVGVFKSSNVYAIADEKVTAYWNEEKFMRPFKLSTQLITYAWALRWHIRNIKNSPLFKELEDKIINAVINGVFVSSKEVAKFIRSDRISIDDSLMDEYEIKLMKLVERLSSYLEYETPTGRPIPLREGILTDSCFGKFNEPCPFVGACYLPDEESAINFCERNFDVNNYNPLEHRDIK